MAGYDRNKDKVIHKAVSKTEKRFLNVILYKYDTNEPKVRICPVAKNTNPNCDSNKKWINQKSISGLSQAEVLSLINALNEVVGHF